MNCPHDAEPLRHRTYEADIQIDECPTCHGMWLDKGELERIQETVENDYRAELAAMPSDTVDAYKAARGRGPDDELNCPSCGAPMNQREHGYCSQIWIDVCMDCGGVWLDEGELRALEVFFEKAKIETRDIRKGFWASLRDLAFYGIVPDE